MRLHPNFLALFSLRRINLTVLDASVPADGAGSGVLPSEVEGGAGSVPGGG